MMSLKETIERLSEMVKIWRGETPNKNKEEYLPWSFINGRPAVRGDLPKLWALAKSKKIVLRMQMKYGILDYTYTWL